MINILYVSTVCSENLLNDLFKTANQKPIQSAQKFHRLIIEGFAMHPDRCNLEILSTVPVTPDIHNKKVWNLPKETVNGIRYGYVPFLNFPYIKNIICFFYTFFKVLLWGLQQKDEKAVICDILNVSIATASLWSCKIVGIKIITIVTDLQELIVSNNYTQKNYLHSLYSKLMPKNSPHFDGYILLTKQMDNVVNPKARPNIIMEGLVDISMETTPNTLINKANEKILIYAGGLYKRYGIQSLIEAFALIPDSGIRLYLYGHGEMVKDMDAYMKKDSRLVYKGIVPNNEVVAHQLKATLLINPRPSHEEFAKYSFPSKNMEYMVSGTPMVTTELPGMPPEYKEFVYLFTDESPEGMAKTLNNLLTKPQETLFEFGAKAKTFVMERKNNKIQSGRILDFLENLT